MRSDRTKVARTSGGPLARTKFTLTTGLLIAIAGAMHAPVFGLHVWGAIVFAGCLVIALALRLHWAVHAASLTTLTALLLATPVLAQSIGQLPVLPLLIPLLISSALVAASRATRATFEWVRWGQVSTSMWVFVGITGIGSAIGLILWAAWTDNLGVGVQMMESVAHIPQPVLVLGLIPVFAVFNAITEEAVFRGVLFTALARSSESPLLANVVQAAAFAAIHYVMGFPNGVIGYMLALVYGLLLGYLRDRTNGLLAPIVAHVIADLVIAYIVLFGPPVM